MVGSPYHECPAQIFSQGHKGVQEKDFHLQSQSRKVVKGVSDAFFL